MYPAQQLLCMLTLVQHVASSWAGKLRHLKIVIESYEIA